MNIRRAESGDIPSIVSLLKLSLGEGLMPKSEKYWQWKHLDNPFGASPVLIAEEDGILVGVRAFMRWEWTDGKHIYKTVRAVDTATHPQYQGKGIFKKLTLGLIEECKSEGVNFVFNTPNQQSRPGYLKMGWIDAARLPVQIRFVNPLRKFLKVPKVSLAKEWVPDNLMLLHSFKNSGTALQTNYSPEYFRWRYETVPVATYYVMNNELETFFFRIKKSKWLSELRITDTFGKIENTNTQMLNLAAAKGAKLITRSGLQSEGLIRYRGPQVTIRNINYSDFDKLVNFKNWSPSLGDLELF